MAGRNPTAWRAPLRRQATRRAGHGRGRSSRDGAVQPAARPGRPRRSGPRPSPASVSSCAMAARKPDPVALGGRGAQQRPVEALVVGADEQARRTIHSASAPRPRRDARSRRPATRCAPPRPRPRPGCRRSTAQSARRRPAKSGPRTSRTRRASARGLRAGQGREAVDVGRHRLVQPEIGAAREARSAVRRAAQRAPGVRRGRVHGGQGDRPVGPERQRPLAVADTLAVEGEVHHELERGRRGGRLRRRRARRPGPGPRPRHRRRSRRGTVGGPPMVSDLRGGGGIRTLTGDGLSALPLPIGLRPRRTHS